MITGEDDNAAKKIVQLCEAINPFFASKLALNDHIQIILKLSKLLVKTREQRVHIFKNQSETFPEYEIFAFSTLRLLLASKFHQTRAVSLRALRKVVSNDFDLKLLVTLRIPFLITLSLESSASILEQMESFKLAKKIFLLCKSTPDIPCTLLQSIVCLGSNDNSRLQGVSLELLRKLSISFPSVCAEYNVFLTLLLSTVKPHLLSLRLPTLLSISFLLSKEETRKHFRLSLDFGFLFSPFSDESSAVSLPGAKLREKLRLHTYAITVLFKTWPGFIILAADPNALKTIIEGVTRPRFQSLRRACLQLLCKLIVVENSADESLLISQATKSSSENQRKKAVLKQFAVFDDPITHFLISTPFGTLFEFNEPDTQCDSINAYEAIVLIALVKLGLLEKLIVVIAEDKHAEDQKTVRLAISMYVHITHRLKFLVGKSTSLEELVPYGKIILNQSVNKVTFDAKEQEVSRGFYSLEFLKLVLQVVLSPEANSLKKQIASALCVTDGFCLSCLTNLNQKFVFLGNYLVCLPYLSYVLNPCSLNSSEGSGKGLELASLSGSVSTKGTEKIRSFKLGLRNGAKKVLFRKTKRDNNKTGRISAEFGRLDIQSVDPFAFNRALYRADICLQQNEKEYPSLQGVYLPTTLPQPFLKDLYSRFASGSYGMNVGALVKSTKVLQQKNWEAWCWDSIELLTTTYFSKPKIVEKVLTTKFFKRIFGSFRLFFNKENISNHNETSDFILALPWTPLCLSHFRILKKLICTLLMSSSGVTFLSKDRRGSLLADLITLLLSLTGHHANEDTMMISVGNLYQMKAYCFSEIFSIVGAFSTLESGRIMLHDFNFYNILLTLARIPVAANIFEALVSNLNFAESIDARRFLLYYLDSTNDMTPHDSFLVSLLWSLSLIDIYTSSTNLLDWLCFCLVALLKKNSSLLVLENVLFALSSQKFIETVRKTVNMERLSAKLHSIIEVQEAEIVSRFELYLNWISEKKEWYTPVQKDFRCNDSENTVLFGAILTKALSSENPYPEKISGSTVFLVLENYKDCPCTQLHALPFLSIEATLSSTFSLPWGVDLWLVNPGGEKRQLASKISFQYLKETNCFIIAAGIIDDNESSSISQDTTIYAKPTLGGISVDKDGTLRWNLSSSYFMSTIPADKDFRTEKMSVDFSVSPHRRPAWNDQVWSKSSPASRRLSSLNLTVTGVQDRLMGCTPENSAALFFFSSVKLSSVQSQKDFAINPLFGDASNSSKDNDSSESEVETTKAKFARESSSIKTKIRLRKVLFKFMLSKVGGSLPSRSLAKAPLHCDESIYSKFLFNIKRRSSWAASLRSSIQEVTQKLAQELLKNSRDMLTHQQLSVIKAFSVLAYTATDLSIRGLCLSSITKLSNFEVVRSISTEAGMKMQYPGSELEQILSLKTHPFPVSLEKFFTVQQEDESITVWNRVGKPIEGNTLASTSSMKDMLQKYYQTDQSATPAEPSYVPRPEVLDKVMLAISSLSNKVRQPEGYAGLESLEQQVGNFFGSAKVFWRIMQYLSRYSFDKKVRSFLLDCLRTRSLFSSRMFWEELDATSFR
eukprot:snap_masked-scaffold_7-processed-gene-7.17-mRNA-1 protein AED:1.00 eAED:1.00 QI:0/0/0/0/1/1/4/0/1561